MNEILQVVPSAIDVASLIALAGVISLAISGLTKLFKIESGNQKRLLTAISVLVFYSLWLFKEGYIAQLIGGYILLLGGVVGVFPLIKKANEKLEIIEQVESIDDEEYEVEVEGDEQ